MHLRARRLVFQPKFTRGPGAPELLSAPNCSVRDISRITSRLAHIHSIDMRILKSHSLCRMVVTTLLASCCKLDKSMGAAKHHLATLYGPLDKLHGRVVGVQWDSLVSSSCSVSLSPFLDTLDLPLSPNWTTAASAYHSAADQLSDAILDVFSA
jgi:hypothetical protein